MGIDPLRLSRAERLLWSYGVLEPAHIDLEGIALDQGARVRYRTLDGCEARLVARGQAAVISINATSTEGRQRFSLAHELAHWICDRTTGSFICAKEDIGPQNAEARSVEALANDYASQLLLPDYLVVPWIEGKRASLDVASSLAKQFNASLTAAAIALARKAQRAACVACHSQTKLEWFRKNRTFPGEMFLRRELHQDTAAFELAFGSTSGMSTPKRESADRWVSGPNAYRTTVESQSIRLPDRTVLTLLSLLS